MIATDFIMFSDFTLSVVPLGKISLGSMWKAAGTLIVEQGCEKLGLFDFISHNVLNHQ